MGKPVRGNHGQFRGSVGDGKMRVPTSGKPMPFPVTSPSSSTPSPDSYPYAEQHARVHDAGVALSQVQAAHDAVQARTNGVAVTPATMPRGRRKPPRPRTTPGGWDLSQHVVRQAQQKGIPLPEVEACVDFPETSYPSRRFPGQVRRTRGRLCVVVDPEERRAITVYLTQVETDLRDDQRSDPDAVAYDQRRKSRR